MLNHVRRRTSLLSSLRSIQSTLQRRPAGLFGSTIGGHLDCIICTFSLRYNVFVIRHQVIFILDGNRLFARRTFFLGIFEQAIVVGLLFLLLLRFGPTILEPVLRTVSFCTCLDRPFNLLQLLGVIDWSA